jgi:hypothetical protein
MAARLLVQRSSINASGLEIGASMDMLRALLLRRQVGVPANLVNGLPDAFPSNINS